MGRSHMESYEVTLVLLLGFKRILLYIELYISPTSNHRRNVQSIHNCEHNGHYFQACLMLIPTLVPWGDVHGNPPYMYGKGPIPSDFTLDHLCEYATYETLLCVYF